MTDIQAILAQLTLEEKAVLCIGANAWMSAAIERLGVPALLTSDGPHGVRRLTDMDQTATPSLPATCFPTASCLASTWDVDLVQRVGEALGEECIVREVDVLLGPGVNMKRSPLGGRNFEYFSEDPLLAGELAAAYIRGVQSKGVGTSLKHYAVNNQEFQRFTINAEVDARTLREIYLPAFEIAVKAARPWTVMSAYNRVNGTFASEHDLLLNKILKDEWGFEGVVVSDWGAVRNRVAALKGGTDWEMPGPQERRVGQVVRAVERGELDEAVLDESVRRILRIVRMAGERPKGGEFDVDAHHEIARQAASEGMVLLKNSGILPLKGVQNIAVIGRSAQEAHFQGGGSSHINPTRLDVPFEELQAQAEHAVFTCAEGYPEDDTFRQDLIDEAADLAVQADVALLFIALPSFKESEGYDRPDLDLTHQQVALIRAVCAVQPNTVVILNNGSPIAMGAWISGAAAVLECWLMGQAGGKAIAEVLFGKANPCGKLAETFPLRAEDAPSYLNWPGQAGTVRYGEGIFIGYRYYETRRVPVLFPFGYGLSYTTFEYGNARVSAEKFKDVEGVTVSVDVTNTGSMAGKEIVQVYVHDREAGLPRPEMELKSFAKVALQPGQTRTVTFRLDFRAFAYYHPAYGRWITEDGEFEIRIAASAADIRARLAVTLESTVELPCILNEESTVKQWLADPRGRAVLEPVFKQIMRTAMQIFGVREEAGGTAKVLGVDLVAMYGDMPLGSVLRWVKSGFSEHPEDIVAGLLAQVHDITH